MQHEIEMYGKHLVPLIDCMPELPLELLLSHPGASVGATSFWTKKGEAATWFH